LGAVTLALACVVSVTHVENFRPKVAYHPEVVRRLKDDERCWFHTQEDAEKWATAFPNYVAHGAAGRAAFGNNDVRRGPVNVDVITLQLCLHPSNFVLR